MISSSNENPEELSEDVVKLNALRDEIQAQLNAKAAGTDAKTWWRGTKPLPPISNREMRLLKILKGHFGKVYSLHWAGNSKNLVSASQDGKLIVWNATTTNKVQAVPLRSSWVMTCAFEQSGDQMVACGGLDNICSVYKLGTEGGWSVTRAHRELTGHEGYLSSCRFNGPNQVITASGDATSIQWDVETNTAMQTFTDHRGDVMSIAIKDKDPHEFASGSTDGTAKIYDTRIGKCTLTFIGHESDVNSVSYFPDCQAIGTGSDDSTCRLFDIRACREVATYRSDPILCGVTSVDFSASGRLIFAGYDDFNCYGWDVTQREAPIHVRCHDNRVSCLQVSPAGNALATGSWDHSVKVLA
eukprot:CAMPEP_0184545268 /NCGR_PEP_ID=MMETSP0199_2-20130426/4191_1 /TAXON_ID=1112570 /ORGANISM="Thraustochytrium sp., Strain LLF1b" /LENGTH=356 /DNA_ID=CAMNT_0026939559 /DNA_START=770 /DNA_END=1843 /DNA_ORIENTATION=+